MRRKMIGVLLFTVFILLLGSLVLAAPTEFTVSWWTVDGGGGTSSNGRYTLSDTIGQADTGRPLTNSRYTIRDGFWVWPDPAHKIYLPLITSD